MKRLLSVEQYILILLTGGLCLAILFPFLQALLLGLFMALLSYPLFEKFVKKTGLSPYTGSILFTIFFIILILLPLFLIGLSLVNDVAYLIEAIRINSPLWLEKLMSIHWLTDLRDSVQNLFGTEAINLNEKALAGVTILGKGTLDFLGRIATRLPGVLVDVSTFLLALFFGLVDGPRLVKLLRDALPFDPDTVEKLLQTGNGVCRGVMLGTLVVSVAQGFLVGMGFVICHIPNPLFFAAITALLSVVPVVGSAPVSVGGIIYLLFNQNYGLAIVLLCFAIAASVSDNILKPIALKGYSSIHPLLGILSALGGLALFGILGVFLGPLIAALTLVVLRVMIDAPRIAPQKNK